MGIEFITPVGRLVQGSMSLQTKMDRRTNQPKLDQNGNQIKEMYLSIAIRKDDPGWTPFYTQLYNLARSEFPHLVDPATGAIKHPKFAFKVQDGDGVDTNGESVKDKPGFAGHWVLKMASRYPPRCFHAGKYDPSQQIQNPDEVIKRGYFIRVAGTMAGNGVAQGEKDAVPGLYVSPNLVELVAFGEEITGGPDASKVFGGAGAAPLPPGASAVPVGAAAGAGGHAPPPPPQNGAPPPPQGSSAPPPPQSNQAAPPPPPPQQSAPPPPPPSGPVYVMTSSANGATREAMLAIGWTDEGLLANGHMIRQ